MSKRALVSTRKGLFTVTQANGSWRVDDAHFVGDPVIVALHDPRDGAWYAALKHGHFGAKMHRSADRGRTWDEIAPPQYPERPADVPPTMDQMRNVEIPWKLEQVWALAIDPAKPGGLWCGTLPGGLFHSPDRGDSWQLNMPMWLDPRRSKWFGGGYDVPGIHSILVDPRNHNTVVLGVSCGGVWQTADHGKTWRNTSQGMRAAYMPPDQAFDPDTQDPHMVARSTGDPDKLWLQHHNGIFRSTDAAESWSEVTTAQPSSFGFAVAVHPTNGDTAWFVPAIKDELRVPVDGKFVVTRTTDGGRSFDVLSNGLPQGRAYDLVYRHALSVDNLGRTLLMGSTTGSLWVSEDAGDAWTHITAHLPPVYAVTWADDAEP